MEDAKKSTGLKKRFEDIKNAPANWKKVQASPYASMAFAYKVRKIIVWLLIPFIIYIGYNMVRKVHANGISGTITRLISVAILIWLCWRIYSTIPMAKKQMDYYKKYPHLINYCPTDNKETINQILNKFDKKLEGGKNNGIATK